MQSLLLADVRRASRTYRTVNGVPLEARLLVPKDEDAPRPALAYFHPGAWRAGGPTLIHELWYLASRGMVVGAFGYRLLPDRNRPIRTRTGYAMRYDAARSIHDCVADAQDAVRWLREQTEVHGSRVVAAGYSSGAHLAAAAALVPTLEPPTQSCLPDALVLYGGVLELRPVELSPLHHVRPGAPPALVLCGARDSLVAQSRQFTQAMSGVGNRCELALFPGGHKAFTSTSNNPVLASSLARVDEFLVSLGYLDAVSDVEQRIVELIAELAARKLKRKAAPRTGA